MDAIEEEIAAVPISGEKQDGETDSIKHHGRSPETTGADPRSCGTPSARISSAGRKELARAASTPPVGIRF